MPVLEISRGLGTPQKSRVEEILHHTFSCNVRTPRKFPEFQKTNLEAYALSINLAQIHTTN